jgi:hypothetical protein
LKILVERHKKFNIETGIAFVDFEKAWTESAEENYQKFYPKMMYPNRY